MEAHSEEMPLKVCRHCSVASRTDADTCPSCGKPYARGAGLRLKWSWWLAIPIVAAAFAIGYFGISKLIDGGGSSHDGVITMEQAQQVQTGVTRDELDATLDGEQPAFTDSPGGKPKSTCLYYGLEDQPDGVWQFCLTDADDKVVSSGPVGSGALGTGAPQPPPSQPAP